MTEGGLTSCKERPAEGAALGLDAHTLDWLYAAMLGPQNACEARLRKESQWGGAAPSSPSVDPTPLTC
jgi:hypothetical protein